jgi:hypothetical protein
LPDNLTSFSSGDVLCHVPNITNSVVPRNSVEVQEQDDVHEVQEISEEETMDLANPGVDPGVDSVVEPPVEVAPVSGELETNGGSPRGGTTSSVGLPSVSRAVTTDSIMGSSVTPSRSGVATSSDASDSVATQDGVVSDPTARRPHTRLQSGIIKPKVYMDGMVRYASLCTSGEPDSADEALKLPKWQNAMQDEFDALQRNGTWSLVPPSRGRNLIDCKWVFKIKR